MGRKYRRSRHHSGGSPIGALLFLILIAVSFIKRYWHVFLVIGIVIVVLYLVVRNRNRGVLLEESSQLEQLPSVANSEESEDSIYSIKPSLMTECEKEYYKAFTSILGSNYMVQPQINLASIINKESHSRYQNELFRNIDFGIFDKNYHLKLLIEINDETHMYRDRIERDKKVKAICENAGIPLIVFWTKYGINEAYIQKRLFEHLPNLEKESTLEEVAKTE